MKQNIIQTNKFPQELLQPQWVDAILKLSKEVKRNKVKWNKLQESE